MRNCITLAKKMALLKRQTQSRNDKRMLNKFFEGSIMSLILYHIFGIFANNSFNVIIKTELKF